MTIRQIDTAPNVRALTVRGNGVSNRIISPVGVSLPLHAPPIGQMVPMQLVGRVYDTFALWDTGATHSVVTKQTAANLGLQPISIVRSAHAQGISEVNAYLVDLHLPNKVSISSIQVTECADNDGHFGVIIGMDIITLGDFIITTHNKITTMSFRCPSLHQVDYVEEINRQNRGFAPSGKKMERNEPCWCGSGKKHKHCHGQGA